MTRSVLLSLILVLSSCALDHGSSPTSPGPEDSGSNDVGPPPPGHHHYVLESTLIPANNSQAREFGLDVDGNGSIDNRFGELLGTFAAMGLEAQPATTQNLDRGATITLVDLFANDLVMEPSASFALFSGANPNPPACASDGTCRHHLDGSATFRVAAGSPRNPPLTGRITTGTLRTLDGTLAVPLTLFADSPPLSINLIGARVVASGILKSSIGTLRIGGGITVAELNEKVFPALREGLQAVVTRDCHQAGSSLPCGCREGSRGQTWLGIFDGMPRDCQISLQEVQTNPVIQGSFVPDLSIGGKMALSFGFQASAVPAGFTAP